MYELGHFGVILGAVTILLVFKDCFTVAWCFRQFNVPSNMNRQNLGLRPGTLTSTRVVEKLLDIGLDFVGK
jgi:hypothetical protein